MGDSNGNDARRTLSVIHYSRLALIARVRTMLMIGECVLTRHGLRRERHGIRPDSSVPMVVRISQMIPAVSCESPWTWKGFGTRSIKCGRNRYLFFLYTVRYLSLTVDCVNPNRMSHRSPAQSLCNMSEIGV